MAHGSSSLTITILKEKAAKGMTREPGLLAQKHGIPFYDLTQYDIVTYFSATFSST